jgi:hypothetical protein
MKCAEHKGALGKYSFPAGIQRPIWVFHIGVAKDSTLLGCDAVSVFVPDD